MESPLAERDDGPAGTGISPGRRALAWGAHLFTASGAVVGVAALIALGRGDLRGAALLMMAAFAIDAVDGAVARAVGVSRVLPQIDGRRLDDVVDFLNYVVVPAVFLVAAGTLLHWSVAALPVLASCYGFSQVAAKTEDDFFLGFPSLWNFVAIYAWGLDVSPLATTAWVAFFSAMVFVPLKYVYPSKLRRLRRFTAGLGAAWVVVVSLWIVAPRWFGGFPVLQASLLYPVYYFAMSLWMGGLRRETT